MFCAMFTTVYCGFGFIVSERLWPQTGRFRKWGNRWARLLFVPAGIRVDTSIVEDLDALAPCVFVANHQNALDIPGMLAALPVEFGFVAKASLANVPVLGRAIDTSPSVYVERRDPRRSLESMRTAAVHIRNGSSVLVFPEGERSYSDNVGPFKKSAFTLAAAADVPVVPVTIHNAYTLFSERKKLCSSGTLRVSTNKSFRVASTTRQDILTAASKARDIITSSLSTPNQ